MGVNWRWPAPSLSRMEAVQSAFGVLQVARSFLARPIQVNFLSCLHADFVGAEKAMFITLSFSFSSFFFLSFPSRLHSTETWSRK